MASKIGVIIGISVALLLMGVLLPIGLNNLTDYTGTYTYTTGTTTATATNATVGNIVAVVLPLMIVVALIMAFLSRKKSGGVE